MFAQTRQYPEVFYKGTQTETQADCVQQKEKDTTKIIIKISV